MHASSFSHPFAITSNFAKQRVAVLAGGWSGERDVSLSSGMPVLHALQHLGHTAILIDVKDDLSTLLQQIDRFDPDVLFNALHGKGGEDGCIQGVLQYLRRRHTHSSLCATAMCMDKMVTKALLEPHGIPFAPSVLVERNPEGDGFVAMGQGIGSPTGDTAPQAMLSSIVSPSFPARDTARNYVLKPTAEGSTLGVEIVPAGSPPPDLRALEQKHGLPPCHWMVEEYIPGRELTVGVLEDAHGVAHPLGVTEIHTQGTLYDYVQKYTEGASTHTIPADIPESVAHNLQRYALDAHRLMGCRGVSRSDFRFDDSVEPSRIAMLEINAQPGLTEISLVPEQARSLGILYQELVQLILERPTWIN
ncbi:MAG: D-alanine--D-alanine ligase [Alphaproteobacteria bacterium]|nr:D-alanine--D-alanine ligase [Alphaproteobacteria bacterium]